MSLTPEQLQRNGPPNSPPATASDGVSGAIFRNPDYFMTSPNSLSLPRPHFGSQQDLILRADGFYGPMDFARWPQPYNQNFPFIAAIPVRPTIHRRSQSRYKLDDGQFFWLWNFLEPTWVSFDSRFIGNSDTSHSVGVIMSPLKEDMRSINDVIQKDSTLALEAVGLRYSNSPPRSHVHFVKVLQRVATVAINRITSTPSKFTELRRGYSEFQRAVLGLMGFVLWNDQHERVGQRSPSKTLQTLGCFTVDDSIAEKMYDAGISVFLLRPHNRFGSQRIGKVVTADPYPGFVTVWPGKTGVWCGPPGHDDAIYSILAASMRAFSYSDPFCNAHYPERYISSWTSGSVTQPTVLGSESQEPSSGPSRIQPTHISSRPAPYNAGQRPTKKLGKEKKIYTSETKDGRIKAWELELPSTQRNIYHDLPESPITPPSIRLWKDVNSEILIHKQSAQRGAVRYHFPDPGMFYGSANGAELLRFWAAFRDSWVYYSRTLRPQEAGLTPKQWRKLLQVKSPKTKHWEADDDAKGEGKEYKDMYLLGHACISSWEEHQREEQKLKGDCRVMKYTACETLTDFDSRLLIWECGERNFRVQFLSVDSNCDESYPKLPSGSASTQAYSADVALHRSERLQLIDQCFPTHVNNIDSSMWENSLAARTFRDRYKRMAPMWKLMNTWRGEKPQDWNLNAHDQLEFISSSSSYTDRWEKAITLYYAQSFYDEFGFPPVLPRCPPLPSS